MVILNVGHSWPRSGESKNKHVELANIVYLGRYNIGELASGRKIRKKKSDELCGTPYKVHPGHSDLDLRGKKQTAILKVKSFKFYA